MGIKGFQRWLASAGCNQDIGGTARNTTGIASASVPVDHLLVDMNGLMHQAYDLREPSLRHTLERTVARTREVVLRFKPRKSLTLVFDGSAPLAKLQTQRERRQGYAIVEGADSSSKRERRAGGDDSASAAAAVDGDALKVLSMSPDSTRPLSEAEITTGSPYVLLVEEAVTRLVLRQLTRVEKLLSGDLDVLISRSCDVGEGEVKISLRLHTLGPADGRHTDDTVVIFSSDSDSVLVGVAALQFHNIWVAHPSMAFATSVGFLLLRWMDAKAEAGLPADLLPAARIDFVFLMNLAGGDFYTGLDEGDPMHMWNKYRHKLCTAAASGCGARRLVRLVPAGPPPSAAAVADASKKAESGSAAEEGASSASAAASASASAQQQRHTLALDVEFFCDVVGKPRAEEPRLHANGSGFHYVGPKGKTPNQRMRSQAKAGKASRAAAQARSGNPGQGQNLASFALWSVEQFISGRCEALGVQTSLLPDGQSVSMASLKAFAANPNSVASCRPRRTPLLAGHPATSDACQRPPLFTFVAAAARVSCLPAYVRRVLADNPQLRNKLTRVTTCQHLAAATDEVLALVQAAVALAKGRTDSASLAITAEAASHAALLSQPDPTSVGVQYKPHPAATASSSSAAEPAESGDAEASGGSNSPVAAAAVKPVRLHIGDDGIAAIRQRCMAFEYVPGTVLRFVGLGRNEVTAVVPERRPVVVASGAKRDAASSAASSASASENDDDDDGDE